MNAASKPAILLAYPSFLSGAEWSGRDEVKASQLILASYLAEHFPVEYVDFEIEIGRPVSPVQIRRFERKVREFLENRDYDILGISCWTSLSYKATMTIARIAREVHPKRLIVIGGYHPTARPEDFQTPDNLVDYVIQGEGEIAFREIAAAFPVSGRPPQTKVIAGPPLQPEQFVGVKWDLVDDMLRSRFSGGIGTLCIYLSRGCPFECAFCMEALKDHTWRPYSVEQAIEQVRIPMERYKVIALAFGDAVLGVQPAWRKEFFRRLVELNPQSWIFLETRPDFLDEEDIKMLSKLKAEIQFGVESCSPEMLRIMNKTRQPEKFLARFREVSHILSDYGVVHGANLIFNHPGETRRTLEETFAFVDAESARKDSSLIWASHGYLHFPGNEIDRNQSFYEQKYGTRFLSPDWWKGEDDPLVASRNIIPSRDLEGEGITLWKKMFGERQQQLKDCLTPKAFRLAAETYFPDWRLDSRYDELEKGNR